jgi:hypothetical protein
VDDFPATKLIVVHPRVVMEDKLLDGLGDSKAVKIKIIVRRCHVYEAGKSKPGASPSVLDTPWVGDLIWFGAGRYSF